MPRGVYQHRPLGKLPIADRFWPKVQKSDGCWEWTASRTDDGYGWFADHPKRLRAHRVSWEMHNGPIPDGMLVLHRCDNPPCVNPAHLFLGTDEDNALDKSAKGRGRNGNSGRTHCKRGHALIEENIYRYGTKRTCRVCHLARLRRRGGSR